MARLNYVTFNQDHSLLAVGMELRFLFQGFANIIKRQRVVYECTALTRSSSRIIRMRKISR